MSVKIKDEKPPRCVNSRGVVKANRCSWTSPNMNDFKLIPLPNGKSAIVDLDDFETLNAFKWQALNRYACRCERRQGESLIVWMHRYIMQPPPGFCVDHVNRDPLDNRKNNLRICTIFQNAQNRQAGKIENRIRPYKGIEPKGKKWHAYLNTQFLGSFDTPEHAAKAYDCAARFYFGEFACTNFEGTESLSVEDLRQRSRQRTADRKTSRYRGVGLRKDTNRWTAHIKQNRRAISLGCFDSKEEAAQAYDRKALELGFPVEWLNFPEAI